jgi:anti-sigma factor RsiW
MSETFQCGDNAALVGYLYDECEPAERDAIDAHLALCAACTAEVAALTSTRLQLSAWAPPEAALGFRVVSDAAAANVLRPARWWTRPMPAWAQAAAAVVLFGTGLSLGIMRGDVTENGGVQPAATVASTPAASTAATATGNTVSAEDLAALEQRLRNEIAQVRTAAATSASPGQANEAAVLARVRALLDESEQRQQRELALRVTQVMRDVDTQRRVDLAQIQGNFRQIEGVTGAQVREQQEVMNYLRRVSQQGR